MRFGYRVLQVPTQLSNSALYTRVLLSTRRDGARSYYARVGFVYYILAVLYSLPPSVDNSEYMRNGDYQPSRFEAQSDAVSVIFGTKTQSNPENTVGVMTMAAKGWVHFTLGRIPYLPSRSPEVLVTPTTDLGKILTALHNARITGESDLSTGIQVAQLALKHRQNKNQRQRIIVFVGSPLNTDEKSLVKLAKKLKKNNVAVDIISFGENEENQARLQTFIDNVQSGDNRWAL
jgi:26S proteasome regulatory subunit N10